jgi:hypothetical protein
MTRLSIALIGLLIGCVVGWYVPAWVYPYETITMTSIGPEAVGQLFRFFGLCVGAPLGFLCGSWLAAHWIPKEPPPPVPEPPKDPHKVEDNLD